MHDRDDGSGWAQWNALPRHALERFDRNQAPAGPGVYALYRAGHPVYIGRAARLDGALAQMLVAAEPAASRSGARRAAAEFLGIASAAAILHGRYRPTPEDSARITRWLRECEVSWRSCASETEAVEREARLRSEPNPAAR